MVSLLKFLEISRLVWLASGDLLQNKIADDFFDINLNYIDIKHTTK